MSLSGAQGRTCKPNQETSWSECRLLLALGGDEREFVVLQRGKALGWEQRVTPSLP